MVRSIPIVPPATPLTDGFVAVRPRRSDDVKAIAASHDPESLRWLDDPPMDAQARPYRDEARRKMPGEADVRLR